MRRSLLTVVFAVAAALLGGCGSLSSDDETIGWSAQRLYGEAKDAEAARDWQKAVKYFDKIEARYPYGRYAQQALLETAYCYYKDDERASSLAAAERFIKLYPNHVNVDYAYYLKGLVNFSYDQNIIGKWATPDVTDRDPKASRDAFDAFKDLVTRYPNSKYAEDGLARMHFIVNALASYEVHVARYYMKRGAYLAAANRAQWAIRYYPNAPALEEAVFVLIKAYDALGMDELRDGADRVMRTNFPDSRYLKVGGATKDVPWWRLWDPEW